MHTNFIPTSPRTALRTYKISTALVRFAAVVALAGGLAFAVPAYAADASGTSQNVTDTASPHKHMKGHSPEERTQRVEEHIKTLHDKLSITDAQEAKWSDVAQAMRDNESALSPLIEARHQNPESMTAVDDLQSYENIAQAHADGLKKLIPVFQALYAEMSDEQMKNADKVFSSYEGHGRPMKMHK